MKPIFSVIIAVHNGASFLKKCLPAVFAAADTETEIILVDDGSTDDSAAVGRQFGARILKIKNQAGAANARNLGAAEAKGEIILFVDADVVIKSNTFQDLRRVFKENSNVVAVFGSYDDSPGEADFFSQYRNLMHYFFHQTGSREAETFWSGFGAIKHQIFLEAGGFDAEKFKIPAIEDIELGYRLRGAGHRILLIPELQAKHLKRWTFYSILRTDFWQRAVPWAEVMLLNPQVRHDLNVRASQKFSAGLTVAFLLMSVLSLWNRWFFIAAVSSLFAVVFINQEFYGFFWRHRGLIFTLKMFPMHLLYFLYSSAAFIYSWINVKILRRTLVVR